MKFMRHKAVYNLLDRRRNEGNFEVHKVEPVENKLAQYKK